MLSFFSRLIKRDFLFCISVGGMQFCCTFQASWIFVMWKKCPLLPGDVYLLFDQVASVSGPYFCGTM